MNDLFQTLSKGNADILQKSVIISNSSQYNNKVPPINAFISNDEYWESDKVENSWIQVILLNDSFVLDHYEIKANSKGNKDIPQKWYLSASNNGREWKNVSVVLDSKLNELGQIREYSVSIFQPFKFFRFTMIGTNLKGNGFFCIGQIFFYGKSVNCLCISTCMHINHQYLFGFFNILILYQPDS